MKDLLSKEHYCYKIYTLLLMKRSTYPPSINAPPPPHPIWIIPPLFLQKILQPPTAMIFHCIAWEKL